MLKVWGFNEPYNGGLSSYALFLMIVSFLQAKNKSKDLNFINLGETLLEFMKYYSDLDSTSNAIACALPGEENGETRNVYPVPDLGQTVSSPQEIFAFYFIFFCLMFHDKSKLFLRRLYM